MDSMYPGCHSAFYKLYDMITIMFCHIDYPKFDTSDRQVMYGVNKPS